MDEIVRAVSKDGFVKISAISGRGMVEYAREIHNMSPVAAAALGRTLCAASILGDLLKEDKATLTVRINGGGPIGTIIAVSDSSGNVRGYVENPQLDAPLNASGKLDVGGVVGKNGMLTVSRDLGLAVPYISSTALVTGEIGEDFTYYCAKSEQIGAACGLGVLIGTDMSVICAGGFLVQLMPGTPSAFIERVEENIKAMGQITEILLKGDAGDIVNLALEGFEPVILARLPVEYRCYCSRERVHRAIVSMGRENLEEIYESGEETEVGCHFCSAKYHFSSGEIGSILDTGQSEEQTPKNSNSP